MSDILSKNPKLENVLRKAVDRIGHNHAKAQDDEGVILSNEGTTHKYDSSNGIHPSRIGQKPTKGTEVYEVLGEQKEEDESLKDKTSTELEVLRQKEIKRIKREVNGHPQSAVKMKIAAANAKFKKLIDAAKQKERGEMDEATGSGSSGGYEAPLFGDFKEEDVDDVMESVIKENVSHVLLEEKLDKIIEDELDELWIGLNYDDIEPAYDFKSQGPFNGRMTGPGYNFKSQGPMNEDVEGIVPFLKKRIAKKIEEAYIKGALKYEKPNTKGGFKDNIPGLEVTTKTLKSDKKINSDYYKSSQKKIKDYLDIKNNSHAEFPHQNNSKTDYKSPMYRNTEEEQDFIDDFRGMGLEDANGVENLNRLSDYLSGSQETGNAQTDKEGKALGNVIVNKLGDKIEKKIKRKREKIAKRKSKMTNLKGITPDVQTVVKEEVNKDVDKIRHLFSYNQTTQ